MRIAFVLVGATLLAGACHSAPSAPGVSAKPAASVGVQRPTAAVDPRRFGAPIAPGDALPLGRVLAAPDQFASRTVTVEARVRRNCTRRGCWMELAESLDPNLPGCRVTFKDYGFFVPLDSAGSTARVQGTVEVETVGAAEVAHLESEGAKFIGKEPDGTAREVRMVATGVEMWREPS